MNDEQILAAVGVKKSFPQGQGYLEILKGLDVEVNRGEALCIVGSSGAGKSTFLQILGTLDRPTQGRVLYLRHDLFRKSDDELAHFRNEKIGFVFQFHHLMSEFTAVENVMMPGRIKGVAPGDCRKRAEELMDWLGVAERQTHYPSELSGGEQQRVAVARALFQQPEILLADEPTGNLDTQNSHKIQDLFFDLKEQMGLTLVVVTHDHQFASRFPRTLHLEDGYWAR